MSIGTNPSYSDVTPKKRVGHWRPFASLKPRLSQRNGRAIFLVDAFAEIVENLGKRRGDVAECQDRFAVSPIA